MVVALVALTVSACGSDSSADNTSGGEELAITSPADGAEVQVPFTLEWTSSVPLGEVDTGRDHVHVFVDGNENDYTVVGGNTFMVEDLPPGEHEVKITLQHADHSPVGPESSISVNVVGGSGSAPSSDDTDDSGSGNGY